MNEQNPSPFANPRFVFSIILVFVFLWGWQYYLNTKYPQPVGKPTVSDVKGAATPATKPLNAGDSQLQPGEKIQPQAASAEEKFFSYEDSQIKWQVSSHGMGLTGYELKTYLDKDKKPIIFGLVDQSFTMMVDDKPVVFDLVKISDTQFIGTASVNGSTIKRSLTFIKDTSSFETETEFDVAPKSISFSVAEKKHKVDTGNFLMPSFEKQDFLFKDAEKVKTELISGLGEGETLNAAATNVSLATLGTQYFTQGYIDKSEILPSIGMNVAGETAKLKINYDLKDSKVTKLKAKFFIGPKLIDNLQKIDPLLPEVMDYGIFGFISKQLLNLMKFLYGIFGNWGLAIIALTLVMRLIMLPFNIVSFKSARAMQKIQPQLAAIREKYKSDPLQVNRETMALMKQHNANPLSSCLPMLIQIPVFFALWKTIGSSIEVYQQPFFGWITDLSAHDHFFVLPILMGITMYFQQKLTPTTMDPMQAKILNFMPIIFSVFMLSLPSGLTLYNFISALFGVTQQYFLLKDNKVKA
jgi:YidC/Oxa1 family membrane protein insertase